MSQSQLFSSTSLSSAYALATLPLIRQEALQHVSNGKCRRALELLYCAFFRTGHAKKGNLEKRLILRSVWEAIRLQMEERFQQDIAGDLEFLLEVAKKGQKELTSAAGLVCDDSLNALTWAMELGKCSMLMDAMCEDGEELLDEHFRFVIRRMFDEEPTRRTV